MLRILIMATFTIVVAGCSSAPAYHDTTATAAGVTTESVPPAVAAAEESPKKPKLSCVQ